jgi:hypothetical protein
MLAAATDAWDAVFKMRVRNRLPALFGYGRASLKVNLLSLGDKCEEAIGLKRVLNAEDSFWS